MKPRPVTDDDILLWAEHSGFQTTPKVITMHPPPGSPPGEIDTLQVVWDGKFMRSPWVADERDAAAIPETLTLWLSVMGGQPPVDVIFISQLEAPQGHDDEIDKTETEQDGDPQGQASDAQMGAPVAPEMVGDGPEGGPSGDV